MCVPGPGATGPGSRRCRRIVACPYAHATQDAPVAHDDRTAARGAECHGAQRASSLASTPEAAAMACHERCTSTTMHGRSAHLPGLSVGPGAGAVLHGRIAAMSTPCIDAAGRQGRVAGERAACLYASATSPQLFRLARRTRYARRRRGARSYAGVVCRLAARAGRTTACRGA